MGGHYYAFIKNKGIWYEFNDARVTRLADDEWKSAFGGGSNRASAYMLMYRRNLEHMDNSDPKIPLSLLEVVKKEDDLWEIERLAARKELATVHVRCDDVDFPFDESETVSAAMLQILLKTGIKDPELFLLRRFYPDIQQAAEYLPMDMQLKDLGLGRNIFVYGSVFVYFGLVVFRFLQQKLTSGFPIYDPEYFL